MMGPIFIAFAFAQNSTILSTLHEVTTVEHWTTTTSTFATTTDILDQRTTLTSVIPNSPLPIVVEVHLEPDEWITPEPTTVVQPEPTSRREPETYQPMSNSTLITLILIVATISIIGLGLFAFRLYRGNNTKDTFPQNDYSDIFGPPIMQRKQRYLPLHRNQQHNILETIGAVTVSQTSVRGTLYQPNNNVDELNSISNFNTFGSRFESFAPLPEPYHDFDETTLDRNSVYIASDSDDRSQ
jgi:hypothetical protein